MRNSEENRNNELNRKNKTNKRNKLIRKDAQRGTTVIEFNLSKAVIMLIIIGVVLAGLLTKEIVTTIAEVNKTELLANEDVNNGENGTENTGNGETENAEKDQNENLTNSVNGEEQNEADLQTARSINGDLGYISSIDTKEVKTGTGPFDKDDKPGNDSSENNDIVRSFDQLTWTYNLTFKLKDADSGTSLKGGVIKITADLPEELANIIEWDIESMKWISNANLSEDGISLSGEYSMSEEEVTIPGNQDVIFVLKVKNAVNGTKIQPRFTFMLEGNEENEKKEITATKEITVSATGRYNIQLHRNTNLEDKTTVDYGEGEVTGRMYGYGFAIQLYNNEYSEEENPYAKGIKGLEYPEGEINFDIELKVEKTSKDTGITEDITSQIKPILWNYRVNDSNTSDLSGNIENREMYFSGWNTSIYDGNLPYGVNKVDRSFSVYNSGDIEIKQEDMILHVTINNYEFDGTFPYYNPNYMSPIYTENIGTFSIGYMQILVPIYEENNNDYYFSIEDKNTNIISASGENITEQEVITDDTIRIKHLITKGGSYGHTFYLEHMYGGDLGRGTGTITKGQKFRMIVDFGTDTMPDNNIQTINKLVKFDASAFELIEFDNGEKFYINNKGFKFKMYYVTKQDGTNWKSQEEMNKTQIEDLKVYKTLEEIPNNELCVGVFFESQDLLFKNGWVSWVIPLIVKNEAVIGRTYGFTQSTIAWKEKLDRNIYSVENENNDFSTYPTPTYSNVGLEYVKTEYDENGQMITGTHKGDNWWGNTLLIVGGDLSGTISIAGDEPEKVNYDLGKNENIVTYNIQPVLNVDETLLEPIKDITLKAQVTLPGGLSYVLGSSKRGGEEYTEPEITENEDGTTTLEWYIYGVTSGQEIEPIEFGARISNKSEHNVQYTTKFVISEEIGSDGISKIGNSEISNRTSTVAINIINLASFRLYKEVVTPIIEKDGEIQYRITGINNSDAEMPYFKLVDIMPYNKKDNNDDGDGRGTEFDGTYTINRIVINQNIDGEATDNSELKLYYTQDEQIKEMNVQDINVENQGFWQKLEESNSIIGNKTYETNIEQSNDGITGILVVGELKGHTELVIDIYATTNNNSVENKYVNSASAQTASSGEGIIQTSRETAQVIERTISGKVWLDENYNNIIDNSEDLGNINREEIWIKLYKENENKELEEVTNVDGEKVEAINPDETGYYEFTHLPAEKYILKIEYNGEKYKLVEKEIGSNTEINSKFEIETGKTDLIEKLNDNSNYMIKEENVNAGLKEKINLEFTKVAEEDHTDKIGGTEFKLYKLVCTEHEEGYHDSRLINVKEIENNTNNENIESTENSSNINNTQNTNNTNSTENLDNSCWQLVDTQTSKIAITNENQGTVKFEDLEINQEYRLVETKASINRIKPEGQWKIEFSLVDGAEAQENNTEITKINNGVEIKIESIGEKEPPAFAITKNEETGIIEELLLPNRAYFQFPASGSIGSKTIYKIGVVTLILGIFLLIIRNKNLIKNKK